MIEHLIEGSLLGLATGTACLATCGPVYFSYLLSEERSGRESVLVILLLSAGRFVSYALFGALVGLLGGYISRSFRLLLASSGYLLFSLFLVFSVVRVRRACAGCSTSKLLRMTRSPLLLGILTGFSICPAFLIALTRAFDKGGSLVGSLLFVGFFVGTTVYMVPFALFGILTTKRWVTTAARVLSVIVAVFFMASGIRAFATWLSVRGEEEILTVGGSEEPGLFSIDEVDTLWIVTVPGYEGDRGADISVDLGSSPLEAAIVLLEIDSLAPESSIASLPELSAVMAPWWVDARSGEVLSGWRRVLVDGLSSRRTRVFAVEYEPYCTDRACSIVDFLQRFSFRCDPDSGFTFLMQNDLNCLPTDCSTCPAAI